MFDIGFWELVLIGVVSLLVFGPERLPRVAREAALWVRKARSMVVSVKAEINQELQMEELRQSLLEEKKKLQKEVSTFKELSNNRSSNPSDEQLKLGRDAKEGGHDLE